MGETIKKEYIRENGAGARTLVSEITGTWEAVTKDKEG